MLNTAVSAHEVRLSSDRCLQPVGAVRFDPHCFLHTNAVARRSVRLIRTQRTGEKASCVAAVARAQKRAALSGAFHQH